MVYLSISLASIRQDLVLLNGILPTRPEALDLAGRL